jgi:N-acetylneuraminate synthase
VKFQKRNPRELLSEEQYLNPHPEQHHAFGSTYGEHREHLEFSVEQHHQLKKHCVENGIGYASSVWDLTSAAQIVQLDPAFIKIPSACNNHDELLSYVRDEYPGDVHISLGMTTSTEEENIIRIFDKKNALNRLVLYICTSAYPVHENQICLLEISRLRDAYAGRIKAVGFSAHYSGIGLDVSAYTLGATWFERHFTKDRTWKGTDQAASLEPYGLYKVVRDLHNTHDALKYKDKEILDVEWPHREKLKFRKHGDERKN